MTPDQQYNRNERMGMMVDDGDMTETEAHEYCNNLPDTYGWGDKCE